MTEIQHTLLLTALTCAASWGAAITSGSFSTSNTEEVSQLSPTHNADLQLTFSGGSVNNLTFQWPGNAPSIIDFSGSWTFTNNFPSLAVLPGNSITVGGQTFTVGPTTSITVNMNFNGGAPIPYTLGSCSPPVSGNVCASITGIPFSMTGSIIVVDNNATVYSDSWTGSGTGNASRIIGSPVGGVFGTYTFTSTPEPATGVGLASGLGALMLATKFARSRRSR